MPVTLQIWIPLSDEIKKEIFLETGENRENIFCKVDLKDEWAKPFRKHFIKKSQSFMSHVLSFSLDRKYAFSGKLSEVENMSTVDYTDFVYKIWLKYCKDDWRTRLERDGHIDSYCSLYGLEDFLSEEEEKAALEIYAKKARIRDAERAAKAEEEKKRFEAEKLERERLEQEKKDRLKAERENPSEENVPLVLSGGVWATTSNPIGWANAKNFMAIITKNPKAPGGLDRVFMEKSKAKDQFYIIDFDKFKVGDCVQFGSTERKRRGEETERAYFVFRGFVNVLDGGEKKKMLLFKCLSEAHCFEYSKKYLKSLEEAEKSEDSENSKESKPPYYFVFGEEPTKSLDEEVRAFIASGVMDKYPNLFKREFRFLGLGEPANV